MSSPTDSYPTSDHNCPFEPGKWELIFEASVNFFIFTMSLFVKIPILKTLSTSWISWLITSKSYILLCLPCYRKRYETNNLIGYLIAPNSMTGSKQSVTSVNFRTIWAGQLSDTNMMKAFRSGYTPPPPPFFPNLLGSQKWLRGFQKPQKSADSRKILICDYFFVKSDTPQHRVNFHSRAIAWCIFVMGHFCCYMPIVLMVWDKKIFWRFSLSLCEISDSTT